MTSIPLPSLLLLPYPYGSAPIFLRPRLALHISWPCTSAGPVSAVHAHTHAHAPSYLLFHSLAVFFSLSLFQEEKPHNAQPTQGPGNPIAKMCTPLCARMQPHRRTDTPPPLHLPPHLLQWTTLGLEPFLVSAQGVWLASPWAEFWGLLRGHVVCHACHLTMCLNAFYRYVATNVPSWGCRRQDALIRAPVVQS